MCFEAIRMREVAKYIGREEILIVDLRDKNNYLKGHVPGARNLPYNEEMEDQEEWNIQFGNMVAMYRKGVNKEIDKILVYCGRGNVSLLVARDLNKAGFTVSNLYGGYNAYRGPVERKYID